MSFIKIIALSIILMFSPLTATVAQAQGERFVLVSHAPDSDSWWNTIKNAIREAGELVLAQSALAQSSYPDICNIKGLKAYTPYINTKNIIKDGKTYDPGQACHEFYPDTGADTARVSTQYKLNDGKECQHSARGRLTYVPCSEFRDYFHKQYSGSIDFFSTKIYRS